MRRSAAIPSAVCAAAIWLVPMMAAAQEPQANRLTAEEEAAGWRLLFDGTLDGWRGYRRDDVPGGWSVQDGALTFTPGGGNGDLMTAEQYADFELSLE